MIGCESAGRRAFGRLSLFDPAEGQTVVEPSGAMAPVQVAVFPLDVTLPLDAVAWVSVNCGGSVSVSSV